MIPTTVTNSPPGSAVSIGAAAAQHQQQQQKSQQHHHSLLLGIASLILEGRPIAEDEYQTTTTTPPPPRNYNTAGATSAASSVTGTAVSSVAAAIAVDSRYPATAERHHHSPRPSTSRASTAGISASGCIINITTNPYGAATSSTSASSSVFAACSTMAVTATGSSSSMSAYNNYMSSGGSSSASSLSPTSSISSAAATTNESTHQRWTQKLCQLRQVSPAAQCMSTEPELVALAINDHVSAAERGGGGGDFEIVRRVLLNRANVSSAAAHSPTATNSSAASSPGSNSDNILHSLQSLATTCLRGGNQALAVDTTPLVVTAAQTPMSPLSYYMPAGSSSKHNFSFPPTSFRRTQRILDMPSPPPMASYNQNSNGAAMASAESANTKKSSPTTASSGTSAAASTTTTTKRPKHGPHCDQFLRKLGLAKSEPADAEEHFCDMSYVNITCSRWRAYCHKMEAIITRNETVCIEVYLGPVGHKILLEQWILTVKEKVPPPTMTLPSLCSAIRSQLYFSQIVAWCDLLRKSDKSIYDTGRVIYSKTMYPQAGDLATPASTTAGGNTSPNSSSPTGVQQAPRRPRLNIFYRIKQYDATDSFNTKPNMHNFPNVNIAENCSLSVCVKSLPRINGGIPKVEPAASGVAEMPNSSSCLQASTPTRGADGLCATTPTGLAARTVLMHGTPVMGRTHTPPPPSSAKSGDNSVSNGCHVGATASITVTASATNKFNCDTKKSNPYANASSSSSSSATCSKSKCYEKIDEMEKKEDSFENGCQMDLCNSSFITTTINSHREKQLQKYRKRMQKRDKKRDAISNGIESLDDSHNSSCSNSNNSLMEQPMEQGDDAGAECNGFQPRAAMISTGTQTPMMTCCHDCGSEKTLICLKCNGMEAVSDMDEELEQVDGRCEVEVKGDDENDDDDDDELNVSSCSLSSSEIITTPRNKAELLLQAIQRTPKNKKKLQQKLAAAAAVATTTTSSSKKQFEHDLNKAMRQQQQNQQQHQHLQNNNHQLPLATVSGQKQAPNPVAASCQVCKRQKTQHTFSSATKSTDEMTAGLANVSNAAVVAATANNGVAMSISGDTGEDDDGDGKAKTQPHTSDPASFENEVKSCCNSTKLTPNIERCTLNTAETKLNAAAARCHTPPTSAATIISKLVDCNAIVQFKTPTTTTTTTTTVAQQGGGTFTQSQVVGRQQTPKPNPLSITCTYAAVLGVGKPKDVADTITPAHQQPLLLRKSLPKINLTPIFCNSQATNAVAGNSSCGTHSAPIPISSSSSGSCKTSLASANMAFSFDPGVLCHTQSQSTVAAVVVDSSIPVQKSYSAPTLPNSLSLSPRFAKQASFYKRRSRHLSDRSERSSLGSDEQLSDEDFEYGGSMYSPAQSPFKCRSRLGAQFTHKPLLGNLEESLLQKRLLPKCEVMGFKVLLGASGGFCPTQLTIPAASYFYELHGETLSTPYLCEIHLPRKGYFVPRTGTVQATLLNPMGTVVRMFVIPYDMRDMPPLHRTFIRQRILAEESIPKQQAQEQQPPSTNGMESDVVAEDVKYSSLHSPNGGGGEKSKLGHFISAEQMKRLRYSIHLRFQTSRSGRLSLHTDIRLLISRRTDCDTAAAHAKGVLEAQNELVTDTLIPSQPKYSARQENPSKI